MDGVVSKARAARGAGRVLIIKQPKSAYIPMHGVSDAEWRHYRRPLPEHIYDAYMRYWGDVTLK